jgi:hypothetical protein
MSSPGQWRPAHHLRIQFQPTSADTTCPPADASEKLAFQIPRASQRLGNRSAVQVRRRTTLGRATHCRRPARRETLPTESAGARSSPLLERRRPEGTGSRFAVPLDAIREPILVHTRNGPHHHRGPFLTCIRCARCRTGGAAPTTSAPRRHKRTYPRVADHVQGGCRWELSTHATNDAVIGTRGSSSHAHSFKALWCPTDR